MLSLEAQSCLWMDISLSTFHGMTSQLLANSKHASHENTCFGVGWRKLALPLFALMPQASWHGVASLVKRKADFRWTVFVKVRTVVRSTRICCMDGRLLHLHLLSVNELALVMVCVFTSAENHRKSLVKSQKARTSRPRPFSAKTQIQNKNNCLLKPDRHSDMGYQLLGCWKYRV